MPDIRKAVVLGFGLGMPLGAVGVWHTDPSTASVALVAGLALVAIALLAKPGRPDSRS